MGNNINGISTDTRTAVQNLTLKFHQEQLVLDLTSTLALSQTTVLLDGTSSTTIAPAPIFTWSPICTPPIIIAPAPTYT